jgi:uracil-DNA glycosylase
LVGKNKVRRFSNDVYWAKPVTGFGDTQANVLIIGLAPGAHGAIEREDCLPETILDNG